MKKIKHSAIVLLISITLSFAPSCYADDYSRFSLTGVSAMALTFGAFGILAFLAGKSSATPQGGTSIPVILSGSNYNLLSINGSTTNGKIIVKNSGTGNFKSFNIVGDISPIVQTYNSCITDPPAAGGQCEIGISYTGTAGTNSTNYIKVTVTSGDGPPTETNSDTIGINIINVPPDTFYNPSLSATEAKGVGNIVFGLVTINKNGVDFLYAGTYSGGVYKSSDRGATWLGINNGITNKNVTALCLYHGYLYAGTYGGGVFRTNDNGLTWTPVNSGLTGDGLFINTLYVAGDTLYAGTDGKGVFKATEANGGITWVDANGGSSLVNLQAYTLFYFGGYLYAGTIGGFGWGVFRTNDGGQTWAQVNNGLGPFVPNIYSICSDGNFLYIGTSSSGSGSKVYKSNIGTISWTEIKTINNTNEAYLFFQGGFLYVSAFDSLYLSTGITYRTNDQGSSWESANIGLPNMLSLYMDNSGYLYAGTNTGVLTSSDNGSSWKNNGFVAFGPIAYSGFAIPTSNGSLSNGGYLFAMVYGLGVFRSNDFGANWMLTNMPPGTGGESGSAPVAYDIYAKNNYLYLPLLTLGGGTTGGMFRSNDSGDSWATINNGIISVDPSFSINAMFSDGSILLATGFADHVFKTTNNGGSWDDITPPSISGTPDSVYIFDSILYVGTAISSTNGNIYRSADNGSSWNITFSGASVYSLYSDDTYIYVGTNNGVYRSVDGTVFTWTPTSTPPANTGCLFWDGKYLYALDFSGQVYKTNDHGDNWTLISGGTGSNTNCLYAEGGYLYVGLISNGILRAFIAP